MYCFDCVCACDLCFCVCVAGGLPSVCCRWTQGGQHRRAVSCQASAAPVRRPPSTPLPATAFYPTASTAAMCHVHRGHVSRPARTTTRPACSSSSVAGSDRHWFHRQASQRHRRRVSARPSIRSVCLRQHCSRPRSQQSPPRPAIGSLSARTPSPAKDRNSYRRRALRGSGATKPVPSRRPRNRAGITHVASPVAPTGAREAVTLKWDKIDHD